MKMKSKSEKVIVVKDLWREFKTYKREGGFLAALKSLFKRRYEIKHALKGISFEVEEGEILGLIGPNGAGKSTLIKILSGVLYPSKGSVKVLGFVPWKQRVKYVRNIGVVFGQKPLLWWDLPAIDTFELHKEIYSIPSGEYKKRLRYMINLLELRDAVKTPVRDLSLGERMKCNIIAALLHNPAIVFLDEPTIGVDIIAKDRIREFIKEVNGKYKTTVIVTTHDMSDIEKLCKRVIVINKGLIIYNGTLSEIRKSFADCKVVDCTFSAPILARGFHFKGCKVVRRRRYQLVLELNLRKARVSNLVSHLVKTFGVANIKDMVITDPPIEDIISLIYRK